MRLLIIEDEKPAARRLTGMIEAFDPGLEILGVLDSVESSVKWLQNFSAPDLMFLDIQLADGLSFDIFKTIEPTIPVIFTTAYDEYALKAFKLHSIDYLLKPIDEKELHESLSKFQQFHNKPAYDASIFDNIVSRLNRREYKTRFTVKVGNALSFITTDKVAYCFADDGLVFFVDFEGKKYLTDHKMETLEELLDPDLFFRINRKMLVQLNSILKIHPYFNNRLKLEIKPSMNEDVVVSRERCKAFKEWVG